MMFLDRLTGGKLSRLPDALLPGRYCLLEPLLVNGHSRLQPGDLLWSFLQAILMGAELPFRTATRFRRVGRNHLNPQALHRLPKLGEMLLVHLASGFRGVPVVTPPIRVKTGEKTSCFSITSRTPRRLLAVPSWATKNIE